MMGLFKNYHSESLICSVLWQNPTYCTYIVVYVLYPQQVLSIVQFIRKNGKKWMAAQTYVFFHFCCRDPFPPLSSSTLIIDRVTEWKLLRLRFHLSRPNTKQPPKMCSIFLIKASQTLSVRFRRNYRSTFSARHSTIYALIVVNLDHDTINAQ